MIVITAGAHIDGELRSEFGEIPPVLLPVGNRPLLTHQVSALRETFPDEPVVLSLPEDFVPTPWEEGLFRDAGVEVITVPVGLSLGQSVLYTLNMAGHFTEPTRILHGDTLIRGLPTALDVVSVGESPDNYLWQRLDEGNTVWSGFFAFAETPLLIRSLTREGGFVPAVLAYGASRPLDFAPSPDWQDLGHLNTYFDARTNFTTQRSFNSLDMSDGVVVKGGDTPDKIAAEARWFEALPVAARTMTPAFYGLSDGDRVSYALEYLPMVPLNEIYVHGRQGADFWAHIFSLHRAWFGMATAYATDAGAGAGQLEDLRRALLVDKTWARIETFSAQTGIGLDVPVQLNGQPFPSLREVAQRCLDAASAHSAVPGLMHGDPCFSNTLHDARNRRLRFLDPRGHSEQHGLLGDLRYDLAKVAHSVVGLYDFIIAGKCSVAEVGDHAWEFEVHAPDLCDEVSAEFLESTFPGFSEPAATVMPETILLFLSMLPLHADDPRRQLGLMLNALRLTSRYLDS